MDNFDLKRFLVENKMTRNSRLLNEQPEPDGIPADDPLAQIPEIPAETPSEPSGEIDKETAKELIFDTKGKFFTVKFIKKDGSERVMNARLGVKKYLKGGTLAYDPAEFNYITVYDMGAKGYRMVNANTIKNLKIGKNEYVIPTAISESQINESNPLYGNDIEEFFRNLLDSHYEGFQEWDINDLDSTSDGGKIEKFNVNYDEFGDDYPYEDLDYDVEFEAEGPYDNNERSVKGQVTVEPREDSLLFSIYYSPEEVRAWDN